MARLIDSLIARILTEEVALRACRARLQARTDPEALHDLRVSLRRLRSLLRPLKQMPMVEPLTEAAKAVGDLGGPLRDLEVLCGELRAQGQDTAADHRAEGLEQGYRALLASQALGGLFIALDALPGFWRLLQREGHLRGLRKRLRKRLDKQRRRLHDALGDPDYDRHRLRLLVKRVRYGAEAYPDLMPLDARLMRLLKATQSAIGDWHDCHQWLLRAEEEPDLAACRVAWRQRMGAAEKRADGAVRRLRSALG
ncbi:CHAD domain-containing protein [Pseudomonas mangiferae]|uniref:CHAD domain-containing protein n=1 Tax=Pseudomonas mangiferae TaxID=2593654 RepID=A0A553GXT0_9PSED|nr:CHAD domain-containing protein [Pseudomonas mangiferae]TRX74311.1 CHAD domain-containing protein [Pseudomonas mangiferae]